MKKALTPILAVIAVIAIIFCFVTNGQKGTLNTQLTDLQAKLDEATKSAETAAATAAEEAQAKLDEANKAAEEAAAKASEEAQAKLDEVTKAAEDAAAAAQAKLDEVTKAAEDAAAEAQAKISELETKVADLEKQIADGAEGAKEEATEAVEEAAAAVTETAAAATETAEAAVEEAAETAEAAVEEAAETAEAAVEEAAETAEAAAEEVAVMSHADYIAAENDAEVVIESYVQDHQSWWDNKVTVYLQSEDGAYFAYEMACSEEDAAKLVPGTKIRVKGYKGEWAGEVEIMDGTFEFVEAEPWIAEAADVTGILADESLADHMNEFVAVKGATIVAQEDGAAFAYKNTEEKTDDLYFAVDVNGAVYNFCVEFYLRGQDTDVYKAVEALNVGDKVDIEGFLYWYNGANLQATSLTVVQ